MCSVVILRRPSHDWPLILAGNRDELLERPWAPPARHWPDRPEVVAGLDQLAGGSWFGLNDHGVVATVLNRQGTLGPAAGLRSRGELVLEALDHADADAAAQALAALNVAAWRPFNLVIADNRDAFVLIHRGADQDLIVKPLRPGLTMVTARDPDDPASPRIARYRPLFLKAAPPDPGTDSLGGWAALLADTDGRDGPRSAMRVVSADAARGTGFATVCAQVVALPAIGGADMRPWLRFAAGAPGDAPWQAIRPWSLAPAPPPPPLRR